MAIFVTSIFLFVNLMAIEGHHCQPSECFRAESAFLLPNTSQASQRRLSPLELSQVKDLIPLMPDTALAGEIRNRGINFHVDSELISQLRQIGVGQETVNVLSRFVGNRRPNVNLRIDKTVAHLGEVVELFAKGNDPDGDPLEYEWITNLGSIKGEGPSVELQTTGLASPAQVELSVTVFDRKGGSDSAHAEIMVRAQDAETARPRHVYDEREHPGPQTELVPGTNGPVPSSPETPLAKLTPSMAMDVSFAGDYALVTLTGTSGEKTDSKGVLSITLDSKNEISANHKVLGLLTGKPCQVSLVPIDNIAKYSLVEIPGVQNRWGKVVVRVLPIDQNTPIHFAIEWELSDTANQARDAGNTAGAARMETEKAIIIKRVSPDYPRTAFLERVEGTVIVSVDVDVQGTVSSARAVSGPNLLREAAENAARGWKFRPARENGRPITSVELIHFDFKLSK